MDLMQLGIDMDPTLIIYTYLSGEIWKWIISKRGEEFYITNVKHTPVICAIVGLALGIVGFCMKVPMIESENILKAGASGIMSGLISTGINQVFKQQKK